MRIELWRAAGTATERGKLVRRAALRAVPYPNERIEAAVLPSLDGYSRKYRLDSRRLGLIRPGAIAMHPRQSNRGVEATEDVFDFQGWRYAQQVSHGVYVRTAILDFLVNGAGARALARA